MKTVLVTGAAGFIGSHAAEFYANLGYKVIGIDNLSRQRLMGKNIKYAEFNLNYLKQYKNVSFFIRDVQDKTVLNQIFSTNNIDVVIHCAGQPGVPTSIQRPEYDFNSNVLASFNLLEAARISNCDPAMVFCSTNKTFGDSINDIKLTKNKTRYEIDSTSDYKNGVNENFRNDLCEHTPYGVSKLCADHYFQEYGKLYAMKTGVFRMSCIYGTRQLGVEEQGWVAHFIISAFNKNPITIFGDGLQVRDLLYASDLINAFNSFVDKSKDLKGEVFCMGGGINNTISLIEFIDYLNENLEKQYVPIKIKYDNWRQSDQKLYVSNIEKAKKMLNWEPKVNVKQGINKLIKWVSDNRDKLII